MTTQKTKPQSLHSTIFSNDNLYILRGINSDSVDLIYLDPPFNSNANYAAPIGSKAAGAAFKDTWTLDDVDLKEHMALKHNHPGLYSLILASKDIHSPSMFSYLIMMTSRLFELHRVLKPTGSIYLHCDPTASHYLKCVMDAIFGRRNFRNEIVWRRSSAAKSSTRSFANNTDTILRYSKATNPTFNKQFQPYKKEYVDKAFRKDDGDGRKYRLQPITDPKQSTTSNCTYELMGVTKTWRYTRTKMNELVQQGRIVQTRPGSTPSQKYYLDEMSGEPIDTIWYNIEIPQGNERTGYPTQKPLKLLERIIKASSNEGDIVLDPFCGTGTTMVAAHNLGRQWIGIDISPKAAEIFLERMQKMGATVTAENEQMTLFSKEHIKTVRNTPRRTDNTERLMITTPKQKEEYRNKLFEEQEHLCGLCEREFSEPRDFELDHIFPKSKGGQDYADNLQLLCASCNRIKRDKSQQEAKELLKKKAK